MACNVVGHTGVSGLKESRWGAGAGAEMWPPVSGAESPILERVMTVAAGAAVSGGVNNNNAAIAAVASNGR